MRPARAPAFQFARRALLTTSVSAVAGPRLSRSAQGALALSGAMALFVCNDTLVKLTAARLPATEIMALRGLGASTLVAVLLLRAHGPRAFRELTRLQVIVRGTLEAAIAFTFIAAVATASLGQINTILQLSPILLTIAASWLLGERVGPSLWLATLAGFVGVVLVVQPTLRGIDTATVLALISAALVAIRDLFTRSIDERIPSLVVTLGTNMAVPLIGLLMTPFSALWLWPTVTEALLLASAACFVGVGNVLVVLAYRSGAEVAVISPFRYSVVLWSLLSSFLVFGDMLNAVALIGAAVIVGSGLYVWRADIRRGHG